MTPMYVVNGMDDAYEFRSRQESVGNQIENLHHITNLRRRLAAEWRES
jgi:hypothetical protein